MGAKRILIVDDERDIVTTLSRNFVRQGFDVFTASNGHEAMIIATEKRPSIVLLDYSLPILDGLDVLRELKKEMPEVMVIVVTGMGSEDVAVEAMKRGARDYVRKPFDLIKLTKLVREYLEEYCQNILKTNSEYVYPLDDEVIHRYEFLRKVYSTSNPDITSISSLFGFSRNMFYVLDREMRRYGVRGLFEKSDKELEEEMGGEGKLPSKKELPRAEEPAISQERYPFSRFVNPADAVQMRLEMMREAATTVNPHIGNICKKYGMSRQLFYTLYDRFAKQGALGLLNRAKGRT
ncbi:MAG: response regulator, partial [Planctomycetota bacterium]